MNPHTFDVAVSLHTLIVDDLVNWADTHQHVPFDNCDESQWNRVDVVDHHILRYCILIHCCLLQNVAYDKLHHLALTFHRV